jgi:pSer/pThr/pTyr-binding forkhead associated (FHA) protein
MFTTPAPSAPTLSTTTTPVSPTSGGRPGRLRGLNYLRTYTQNHLHARSDSEGSNRNHRPSFARARSQPGTSAETSDSARAKPEHSSQRLHNITNWAPSPGTTSGWQPTPGGRGGVSRVSNRQPSGAASTENPSSTTAPTVGITTPASSTGTRSMTRNRADTAAPVLSVRNPPTSSAIASRDPTPTQHLPSIRFIPHIDPRATRPSLSFPSVSRTLPNEHAIIKVGRYSERETAPDIAPNTPSSAPVGFKSKVVSRRHCEFWCQGHQWYVKDVKSSSGTFLNHLRLSPPGAESKPWPVNDGDVIQLGIDFKGGEEAIFRCVKMRIEVNRSWQKAPNNFK